MKRRGSIRIGKFFLIIFLIELVLYGVISSLHISDQSLLNSFNNERNSITSEGFLVMSFSIFKNNFTIASIEAIPVIGPVLFGISSFDTAFILAIEGTSNGVSGLLYLLSLFLLPDTLLEIPSYAISTSIGTYFLYRLFTKRDQIRQTILKSFLLYGFVALELYIAASFESYEIILERTNKAPYNLLYPLMMWIPAVPAFIFLIFLFRRIDASTRDKISIKNEMELSYSGEE